MPDPSSQDRGLPHSILPWSYPGSLELWRWNVRSISGDSDP